MAMGDPPRCLTCGMYETLSRDGVCNACCTCEGAVSLATSTDIALSTWQLVDAHGWIMIDCPLDGGIIFSDKFLTALKAQLSEHETEKESKS